jgi:deoxynucleoside triphosphate triphosphohydrolase SAMHD1
LNANKYLKISEKIKDPKEYINLTDSILHEIKISKNYELEESRKILSRLSKRDLYKFVDEHLFKSNEIHFNVNEKDIVNCQNENSNLFPDDIILHNLKINYAMKGFWFFL